MKKPTPEELANADQYTLLAEVDHREIKHFIMEQITPEIHLIRWYSAYQVAMIILFIFLLIKSIILSTRGLNAPLQYMGAAALFSFSLLIIVHEMLHAVAYYMTGARKLKAGAIWHKFIFYVAADRQVVDRSSFRFVANLPFVAVKLICAAGVIVFWSHPAAYFFFAVMCIHSLFCAGDMAMLAYYHLHSEKEIYNYDDLATGKTFFYFRNKQ